MEKNNTTDALQTQILRRLHLSSFFMLTHAGATFLPLLSLSLNAKDLDPQIRQDLAKGREVWEKWHSDMPLETYSKLADELWHCKSVDSFEQYLSDLLRLIFRQKPETLKSDEQVRIADVLDCGSLEEVLELLSERKVSRLSFDGFDAILSFIEDKLGLSIPLPSDVVANAREAIEVRHLIVHNDCRITQLFARRTKRNDLPIGSRFPLTQDYVIQQGRNLFEISTLIDRAAITHFHLPSIPKAPRTTQNPTSQ